MVASSRSAPLASPPSRSAIDRGERRGRVVGGAQRLEPRHRPLDRCAGLQPDAHLEELGDESPSQLAAATPTLPSARPDAAASSGSSRSERRGPAIIAQIDWASISMSKASRRIRMS